MRTGIKYLIKVLKIFLKVFLNHLMQTSWEATNKVISLDMKSIFLKYQKHFSHSFAVISCKPLKRQQKESFPWRLKVFFKNILNHLMQTPWEATNRVISLSLSPLRLQLPQATSLICKESGWAFNKTTFEHRSKYTFSDYLYFGIILFFSIFDN